MLPFCFVWIVVAIKNSVDMDDAAVPPAFLPDDMYTLIPLSYEDYMQAFQARRACFREESNEFSISGIPDGGYNWQVPFVRCDSRKCQYLGQDANPFCEYSMMAVSGSTEDDIGGSQRAKDFQTYMYNRWPFLLNMRQGREVEGRPFPFEFVQIFRDPSEIKSE